MKWVDKELYRRIGLILKNARTDKNISLDTLSELMGNAKTKSSLQRYENGEVRIDVDTFNLLCNKLGLNMNDVMKKVQSSFETNPIEFANIPLYDNLCCGNGGFVDENILDYIPVPAQGLSIAKDYFCQYAKGDSMKDAGIFDGDLLVFEKSTYIENNQIGCFCIDENMATCKKYKNNNGIISLNPMNSSYDPIIIDISNGNFRCLGILKFAIKRF